MSFDSAAFWSCSRKCLQSSASRLCIFLFVSVSFQKKIVSFRLFELICSTVIVLRMENR